MALHLAGTARNEETADAGALGAVTYGVDAIRRIVLLNGGVPDSIVDQLGVSLFGAPISIALDLLLLGTFAGLMIVLAMRMFEVQD